MKDQDPFQPKYNLLIMSIIMLSAWFLGAVIADAMPI